MMTQLSRIGVFVLADAGASYCCFQQPAFPPATARPAVHRQQQRRKKNRSQPAAAGRTPLQRRKHGKG